MSTELIFEGLNADSHMARRPALDGGGAAPRATPVTRVDETLAARRLITTWSPGDRPPANPTTAASRRPT